MKKRNVYFVILAGGSGTRLWPLSTSQQPKQLLVLADNKTLLENTIKLVRRYSREPIRIWISVSSHHAPLISQHITTLVDHIAIEPQARNTGPAILYNCLQIYEQDPDALVLFLPADAYIPYKDALQYVAALEKTFEFVKTHQAIALLGVKPTHPATGYGYIEYDITKSDGSTGLYYIKKFHEKPNLHVAQEYMQHNGMLWNIGMFCGQVKVFLNQFKHHTPELYSQVIYSMQHNDSFDTVPSISVDYALIERSDCTWVLPVDFSWCDVGNVKTFLSLKQQESKLNEKLLLHNASNNLVDVPDKLVALVGVHDLCIIQSNDVLLITHSSEAEQVSAIVKQLQNQNLHKYI
jgi:mannose-1-phosphate guanylyltransferase